MRWISESGEQELRATEGEELAQLRETLFYVYRLLVRLIQYTFKADKVENRSLILYSEQFRKKLRNVHLLASLKSLVSRRVFEFIAVAHEVAPVL